MLKTSNVIVAYGGKTRIHCPDISLEKGEECLITGASGSGKTTLLYSIAGLIVPIAGHILINNTNITSLSEAARDRFRGQHIGIIFQTLHLIKSLSILDNILLAAYMAGQKQQKSAALAALKRLNLLDKKDALPSELSQGQQQRAAIARALLLKPALILADEPTSSLDDHNTRVVITLIKEIAKETGATLLISTHDSRIKPHFSTIISLGEAA